MIRNLALASAVVFTLHAAAQDAPQAPPPESDMTVIFNGKDLTGWDGDPRLWSVKDGAIHGETTPEKRAQGNTFLIWKDGKTKDFELRLSFRCNATNNSGIQYRSAVKEAKPGAQNQWRVKGYQHEIRNQNKLPSVSGFIYGEGGKRGRMCLVGEKAVWDEDGKKVEEKLITKEEFAQLFKLNEWNDVVITAKGNHIRHYMNGRLILDFTDRHPTLSHAEGVLAFQLHAGKPMWAEFKDVRIKELK